MSACLGVRVSGVEGAPLTGGVQLYDAQRGVHYDKPRLRGWAHLLCFEASLVVGTLLIVTAQGGVQTAVGSVYAASVAGMFGASTLYHRGNWGPRTACWLQRLDHLMIFMIIAGTATPPLAICLPAPYSVLALAALWSLTAIAALVRLVRMRAPEWLAGAVFLGLGWAAGAGLPAVWVHAGIAPAVLLIAGGLLDTIGALAYHRRRPDPVPAVFGYHEVFHTFICMAVACQYVAIACFLL
jgi:hemolysin III